MPSPTKHAVGTRCVSSQQRLSLAQPASEVKRPGQLHLARDVGLAGDLAEGA
jgi:hypothetical protein